MTHGRLELGSEPKARICLPGDRLEQLRATVPRLRRVAALWHHDNPTNPIQLKGAQAAARTLGGLRLDTGTAENTQVSGRVMTGLAS